MLTKQAEILIQSVRHIYTEDHRQRHHQFFNRKTVSERNRRTNRTSWKRCSCNNRCLLTERTTTDNVIDRTARTKITAEGRRQPWWP